MINQYARELGILKEKDANFTGADIRNGMTAIVSIKHPDPRFEGQTKTKLDNPDASKATSKVTNDEIIRYFDRNIETLKNGDRLCGKGGQDPKDRREGKD